MSTKPNPKFLTLTLWTWLAPLWTWLRLQPALSAKNYKKENDTGMKPKVISKSRFPGDGVGL